MQRRVPITRLTRSVLLCHTLLYTAVYTHCNLTLPTWKFYFHRVAFTDIRNCKWELSIYEWTLVQGPSQEMLRSITQLNELCFIQLSDLPRLNCIERVKSRVITMSANIPQMTQLYNYFNTLYLHFLNFSLHNHLILVLEGFVDGSLNHSTWHSQGKFWNKSITLKNLSSYPR